MFLTRLIVVKQVPNVHFNTKTQTLASHAFVDCRSRRSVGHKHDTCKVGLRCDATYDVATPCLERTRIRIHW